MKKVLIQILSFAAATIIFAYLELYSDSSKSFYSFVIFGLMIVVLQQFWQLLNLKEEIKEIKQKLNVWTDYYACEELKWIKIVKIFSY